MRATAREKKHAFRKRSLPGLALAALFAVAQLLVAAHHTTDAHSAPYPDDGFSVECDVCTVSAGVFDITSTKNVPFIGNWFIAPAINWIEDAQPSGITRLQHPRAPPAIN